MKKIFELKILINTILKLKKCVFKIILNDKELLVVLKYKEKIFKTIRFYIHYTNNKINSGKNHKICM